MEVIQISDFIYFVVTTIICNTVFFGLLVLFLKKTTIQKLIDRFWISLLVSILLGVVSLSILFIGIQRFALTDVTVAFGLLETIVFITSISTGCLVLKLKDSIGIEWFKIIRWFSFLGIVLFFLEIGLFNFSSFTPTFKDLTERDLVLSQAIISGDVEISKEYSQLIVGNGGGEIIFPEINSHVEYLNFDTQGADEMHQIVLELKDDNFSDWFIVVKRSRFSPAVKQNSFSLFSDGNLKELKITFRESVNGFSINKVVVNRPPIFRFNTLRYFGILLILYLLVFVWGKQLWKVSYNRKLFSHKIYVLIIMIICLIISGGISLLKSESVVYPLQEKPDYYGSAYVQQFDAWQKGQLNLDIEVDPKLESMENPYDISARVSSGVNYFWDRAFFDGKYYSYYGIAPILTVYYPYYIFFGSLPSDLFVGTIFSILAIIFMFLLLLELIKLFRLNVNLVLLLVGLFSSIMMSSVYMLQSSSDQYYLPILSGSCFLLMFLFFSFKAYLYQHNFKRLILFFLAGLSFVLVVASRPNIALFGLLVVPIFLHILFRQDYSLGQKFSCAISFLLPVIIGGFGLVLYNFMRFSSCFEFGLTYQLTVDDASHNIILLRNLFPSLYHYFFQQLQITANFPFLHPAWNDLGIYGRYIYNTATVGVFAFPAMLVLFLLPVILTWQINLIKKYTYLFVVITAVLVSFLSFSLAGVHLRYVADVLPVLAILSTILLLEINEWSSQNPQVRKLIWSATVLLFVASIFVGVALIFSNERNNILVQFPQIILYLERMFIFW